MNTTDDTARTCAESPSTRHFPRVVTRENDNTCLYCGRAIRRADKRSAWWASEEVKA